MIHEYWWLDVEESKWGRGSSLCVIFRNFLAVRLYVSTESRDDLIGPLPVPPLRELYQFRKGVLRCVQH